MYPVIQVDETTTPQQVFDAVVGHLKVQGKQSKLVSSGDDGGCKYRLGDLACAVGCLMSDAEAWLCDNDPKSSAANVMLFRSYVPRLERFTALLRDLQGAHDHSTPGRALRVALEEVARRNHLSTQALDSFHASEKKDG